MKTTLFIIISYFYFSSLFGQEIVGSWVGELDIPGAKLPLVFNIKPNGNEIVVTMDSPMQGVKDIPITKATFDKNELALTSSNMQFQYKGALKSDEIEGSFSQGQMSLPLVLKRKKDGESILKRPQTPIAPFDYKIEEVTFENATDKNTLTGTLTTPNNKKEFPIVILITGSGQQNRDSEIFGHKSFWVIADDFTKKGIGVLRIDDRGIGGSNGLTENLTTQNFASDSNSAVEFLAKKGYKNIGLVGHSEGGIIATMVASQNKKVKFIVSMAGPGIPIDELLFLQSNAIAKLSGATEAELKSSGILNRKIYSVLKNFSETDLKNGIKEILSEEMKKLPVDQQPNEKEMQKLINEESKKITSPWFIYFIKLNPDDYWNKLKIPVLAINGTLDIQVVSEENLNGIKSSLEKANNKQFEIVAFSNLNHLFQEAKIGSVEEYAQIEQTIAPAVLDKMSSWILKR
jgi:pimeloyl-ACP methyl ester carboxylesterase